MGELTIRTISEGEFLDPHADLEVLQADPEITLSVETLTAALGRRLPRTEVVLIFHARNGTYRYRVTGGVDVAGEYLAERIDEIPAASIDDDELTVYRANVIAATECGYCGSAPRFQCLAGATPDHFVEYVHDDRSAAYDKGRAR